MLGRVTPPRRAADLLKYVSPVHPFSPSPLQAGPLPGWMAHPQRAYDVFLMDHSPDNACAGAAAAGTHATLPSLTVRVAATAGAVAGGLGGSSRSGGGDSADAGASDSAADEDEEAAAHSEGGRGAIHPSDWGVEAGARREWGGFGTKWEKPEEVWKMWYELRLREGRRRSEQASVWQTRHKQLSSRPHSPLSPSLSFVPFLPHPTQSSRGRHTSSTRASMPSSAVRWREGRNRGECSCQ